MMPPITDIQTSYNNDNAGAFSILNNEESTSDEEIAIYEDTNIVFTNTLPKNVNIVKPLRHSNERNHLNSANKEMLLQHIDLSTGPQTILDPKFSKALDFKLRRLMEKETLLMNIKRPSKFKPKHSQIAASNPNISLKLPMENISKTVSRSHPRIDKIETGSTNSSKFTSRTIDKSSISPDRRSRLKRSTDNNNAKPKFITTVKSGVFLLPPPDMAVLLGLESLLPEEQKAVIYSYSSKPKALPTVRRAKRDTSRDQNNRQNNNIFSGIKSLVTGLVGTGIGHHNNKIAMDNFTDSRYNNLMHEKRICRGSNYALHAGEGDAMGDKTAARRRAMARKRRSKQEIQLRPGTPPPVPGRKHHPIQTERYLEELFDKGEEMDVGCQTDLFLDRPATPIYVPAKTGMDNSTQIYEGDLFDFDLEVEPILEVLVGKTVEQAMNEVAREEEIAAMKEQQRRYIEIRDAERAEQERLAEQDRRLKEEKDRRLREAVIAKQSAIEARERAGAATLVQGYLADLVPSVVDGLDKQGFFVDKNKSAVDELFMPWLLKEVGAEIQCILTSRDIITEIVREILEMKHSRFKECGEREYQELQNMPTESPTDVGSEFGYTPLSEEGAVPDDD